MKYVIEICSNSVQSALNAQSAGAGRVELCDNLWESGTTPGPASLKLARSKLSIALFVLIRPRGGDFFYSDLEVEIIKQDILFAKEVGVDGIVSGALNLDLTINKELTGQLVELAHPLPFTFHRAFDVTPNLSQSLNDLIDCGVNRVLTSGGQTSAIDGSRLLASLHHQARDRIIVMPGGGINEGNIHQLLSTGCQEFHLTGSERYESPVKENAKLKLNGTTDIPENDYMISSTAKIKRVIDQLQKH